MDILSTVDYDQNGTPVQFRDSRLMYAFFVNECRQNGTFLLNLQNNVLLT